MFDMFQDWDVISEAEIWLIDNGILPSSVRYNIYKKKRLLYYYQDAVAVAGIGSGRDGNNIGFAVEVAKGRGVVRGGILEPDGVATWGRKATFLSLQYDKPLVDVFQELARDHRINSDYYSQSSNETEPVKSQILHQLPKAKSTQTSPQPQSKPFTLPFHIKDKPEYQPTIGIKSNQVASSFIVLIRRITIGYLKSCMEDDSDFCEGHFNNPVFVDDRLTVGNANTIVQFIHDYVWYIMSENTPIASNHRLVYGIKYTPFILNITNNFHQEMSVIGIQKYVESLIDYYIEIILVDDEPSALMMEQLSNSQSQEMQSVNITPQQARIETNNKKQKSDDKGVGILEIIGFCAMGLIMYNGVLKEKFNSSPKESVTTKAPDLIEQPLPNTGDTDNPNFYGDNPLIIKTQYGKNYWVRISNSINDATMASYFVRGGDTLNIEVPKGSYTIKYASGDSWYGTAHLFGKKTQYAKADKVFEFNNNGYTIELIYQTNGNLNSKQLNANQF